LCDAQAGGPPPIGRCSLQMKHVAWHHGLEICRTSAGHFVVVDPRDGWEARASTVRLLADNDWLDFLFFPSPDEARASIDRYATHSLPS
jgi:hypothetical protein